MRSQKVNYFLIIGILLMFLGITTIFKYHTEKKDFETFNQTAQIVMGNIVETTQEQIWRRREYKIVYKAVVNYVVDGAEYTTILETKPASKRYSLSSESPFVKGATTTLYYSSTNPANVRSQILAPKFNFGWILIIILSIPMIIIGIIKR